MKALCIVEPGHTELVERPVPVPAAGEVLVRVAWVGYCGSDLNTFRGQNPMVTFPRIPGHEVSAVWGQRCCGTGPTRLQAVEDCFSRGPLVGRHGAEDAVQCAKPKRSMGRD